MAWLTGWNYRKKITIAGSTGAGTNYQVLLKIGESSGASGYDFHLEGHSANFPSGKNQGGDLIFTDDDETTLLDFWVESVTGSSPNRVAYVWVEVADDLGSNRDIYCYYGNSSATNYSNGDNTFLAFDDFDSLNTTKWDFSAVSASVSSSHLVVTGGTTSSFNCVVYKLSTFDNAEMRAKQYSSASLSYAPTVSLISRKQSSSATTRKDLYFCYTQTYTSDPYRYSFIGKDVNGTQTELLRSYVYYDTTQSAITILRNIGTSLSWQCWSLDYSTNYVSISTTDSTFSSGYWGPNACWNNKTEYIDWVFIRKYISPEPSFSSASSEQLPVANTGNFFLFF